MGAGAQRADGALIACAEEPKPQQKVFCFLSSFHCNNFLGRTVLEKKEKKKRKEMFINPAQKGKLFFKPVVSCSTAKSGGIRKY